MANIYDMADTWNDGGTTFTAIKMDVTDTASASGSLLMDLKVGASSKFSVSKGGLVRANDYYYTDAGFYIWSGTEATSRLLATSAGKFTIAGTTSYVGFAETNANLGADLILSRKGPANLQLGAADAAGPAAQTLSVQSVVAGTSNTAGQNFTIQGSAGTGFGAGGSIIFQVAPAGGSGTGQNTLEKFAEITSGRALNLYNTFTDATNFERGFLKWNSNTFEIGTDAGGSGGTARSIEMSIGGTPRLSIAGSGVVTVSNVEIITASSISYIGSAASGFTLRYADGSDSNLLVRLAGATSSFPALKRNTTSLQARLADDSAFTNIQGKLTTDTAYTAGAPTPTGYLVVYDSTGTAYKIPAVL